MMLAIDPGIKSVAWALLEVETGKLVDCGVIYRSNKMLVKRDGYIDMVHDISRFMKKFKHKVTHVAIEWLTAGHVGSVAGMSAVVGAAIATGDLCMDAKIIPVYPQTWKRAKKKEDAWLPYLEGLTLGENLIMKSKIDEQYKTQNKTVAGKSETDIIDAICVGKYVQALL